MWDLPSGGFRGGGPPPPPLNRHWIDHVPMFTGCPNYYTWPIDENFARVQLMMFSEGLGKEQMTCC